MLKLIFVFLLASTLGADLSHLLEQLSQGERGEYLFDFQSPSSSGFNIFTFCCVLCLVNKNIVLGYHFHSVSEVMTKYIVIIRTSCFSDY